MGMKKMPGYIKKLMGAESRDGLGDIRTLEK